MPVEGGAVLPEFRLQKVLVPIDFSDCSKKALQYAIAFAKQFNGSLTLLHVVPIFYPPPELSSVDVLKLEEDARVNSEKQLKTLLETEVGNTVPGVSLVQLGNPARQIVEVAKALDIDLIIISTHGRTGLQHLLIGSTAEHVVRYASCPVLVVRENEHEFLRTKRG